MVLESPSVICNVGISNQTIFVTTQVKSYFSNQLLTLSECCQSWSNLGAVFTFDLIHSLKLFSWSLPFCSSAVMNDCSQWLVLLQLPMQTLQHWGSKNDLYLKHSVQESMLFWTVCLPEHTHQSNDFGSAIGQDCVLKQIVPFKSHPFIWQWAAVPPIIFTLTTVRKQSHWRQLYAWHTLSTILHCPRKSETSNTTAKKMVFAKLPPWHWIWIIFKYNFEHSLTKTRSHPASL